MSRITTSCASFSWARPAMRRACSSDVSVASDPFRGARSVAGSLVVEVEPERMNQLCDRRRDESVDRLSRGNPVANLARGDRQRLDLEQLDAVGPGELRQHRVEAIVGIARTRRDSKPSTGDNALRILPGQEVAELVGADQEERIAPAPRLEHVYGPLVGIELDLVVRERGPDEAEAGIGIELHLLVSRPHRHEDDELLPEALLRGPRQRKVAVVRWIERPAQKSGHSTSSTSPSTSTSSPLRAPAALSAAVSSSSSEGRSPAMRKPRSRSEEHTSELQSHHDLVCRLLLEKKKKKIKYKITKKKKKK